MDIIAAYLAVSASLYYLVLRANMHTSSYQFHVAVDCVYMESLCRDVCVMEPTV